MSNDSDFTFEISLSVLNHLGRNLYRSFITILGEAISNSWDADSDNVWIYVDRDENYLVIKDDGLGMSPDDFQNKFLKIGYTKRREGNTASEKGRPYIGRKGIGKLAMLSCADRISVISKKEGSEYTGGTIDNPDLDEAIDQDINPQEYNLESFDEKLFSRFTDDHSRGTIVHFDGLKEGIRNTIDYLRYAIALYFRFSLIDNDFNIFLNGEKVTIEDLERLSRSTEFIWVINNLEDQYLDSLREDFDILEEESLDINIPARGFIASVKRPRDLKVFGAEQKASVDLFVNGRLRERDIIKHIPTARIPENYLYGQIHYDDLDDEEDRFATGREGIKADDRKYKRFLEITRVEVLNKIMSQWDKWRGDHREEGDPENESISKKERKSRELYHIVSNEYSLPSSSENKDKVDGWVDYLEDDAQFNFSSYAECFISENLLRSYIAEEGIELSPEARGRIKEFQGREERDKNVANLSIDLRQGDSGLSYLDMDDLSNLIDKPDDPNKEAGIARDAKEYKPIRNALAHTALLTDLAKDRLTTVYENIKSRLKILLSGR